MIKLIIVFFSIGLFTIGGGMVAIPIVQQEVVSRGWISIGDFYQMIAVAESTPGPIGINIATYVGYDQFGVIGAIISTTSFILPSFSIIVLLSKYILEYRESELMTKWFLYLKSAIVGLIAFALVNVVDYVFVKDTTSVQDFDFKALILLGVLSVCYYFLRKKPWVVIILGGVLGALFL